MKTVPLGPFPEDDGYEEAVALDAADPLADYRHDFVHTDESLIYLDGNSIGRQPVGANETIRHVTEDEWGDRLIRAWNEGWWELHVTLGDKLAPIIGARPGEVIISDSTSVNLYKLALSAVLAAGRGRTRIVTDDLNFPTDVYILDGIARQHGMTLEVVPSDGINGPIDSLAAAIDDGTALVSLSHTTFKSGYTYDLTEVTAFAHDSGAMVLWDCSHSAGVVPIDVEAAGVDLAVGCTYKYLNGGPGSPAFLYVRGEHQDRLHNPITGWWGHADPFGFGLEFEPVDGIGRFHVGTMPILSLAGIEPGLDGVISAGMPGIRSKSEVLTGYLIELVDLHLAPLGFTVATPREPSRRGSHVSLGHGSAWPITRAMIEVANVIPDFRAPDNIRLGLSPLYTRFVDVHTAVGRVRRLVELGLQEQFVGAEATVT
ncbi:MAG TPA: kynureninase [Acidimicrobiia bacterium]|nr:kynureninase [Acidimicrobiia bacterium]